MLSFDTIMLAAAAATPAFDPEAATRAYLATLSGAARARSDAYFEGGYWLPLWGALVAIVSLLADAPARLVGLMERLGLEDHPSEVAPAGDLFGAVRHRRRGADPAVVDLHRLLPRASIRHVQSDRSPNGGSSSSS